MVRESVEAWAWTSEIVGSRRLPSMHTRHVDKLVLVKSREWDTSRTTLSFLLVPLSLIKMAFQEIWILERSLCIGTKS